MLRRVQRQYLDLILILLASGASCNRGPALEKDYRTAQDLYQRRQLQSCLDLSRASLGKISRDRHPDLHFRFRLLEATTLISLKEQKAAWAILSEPIPANLLGSGEAVLWRMNRGMAQLIRGDYAEAGRLLDEALQAAKKTGSRLLVAEVETRLASLALRKQDNDTAEALLRRSLDVATQEGSAPLRTMALGNLGVLLTQTFRLEEAVYWQEQAAAEFRKSGDLDSLARITGNLGWSWLLLGDLDGALKRFEEAEAQFGKNRNRTEQLTWLGNIGNVYLQRGEHAAAEASYARALQLARDMDNKLEATWWLNKLASVAIAREDWRRAESLNLESAKLAGNTDLDWVNNTAAVAAGLGRSIEAEALYKKAAGAASEDPVPILNAHAGLAALYAATRQYERSHGEYRATLALVERERDRPLEDRLKLPYLASLMGFYQQYVDFLVSQKDVTGALRVADSSHARMLGQASTAADPSSADYRQLARRTRSVLLCYWLAPKRSFLWEISSGEVNLRILPGGSRIRSLISRHNHAITSLRSPLDRGWGAAGEELWNILIAPAAAAVARTGRVIIVPDGALHSLNLESLPVAQPAPHFWVGDATISVVPALRFLRPVRAATAESLLLIGDPEPSGPEFPRLAFAAKEVAEIEKLFSQRPKLSLTGKAANPGAYLNAAPARFSLIHFTAHASSNTGNPLQSAIVLSRDGRRHLLSAADIMKIPLRARLVTISACGGAGSRIYSGEGLVGLTWAFLRAGAQGVIAGLWDVPDSATSQLMGVLYSRLATGEPPDEALREAKIAMLAAGANSALPYNWAAFQHYVGSY